MKHHRLLLLVLVGTLCTSSGSLSAQPEANGQTLEEQSLALRTALHYDPSLDAPLERLVALYRKANRVDELFNIYRTHLAQFPQDFKATTVLVRLLATTGDREALRLAKQGVQSFPQDAYLHFLYYELLKRNNNPNALEQLDKAIDLEQLASRKATWIEALLSDAVLEDKRDLAEKHIKTLTRLANTPDSRLQVGRRLIKLEFYKEALALLERTDGPHATPEIMVETQMEAANAEVGLKQNEAAVTRLDNLLKKLTADYWRRPEIVRRRLVLIDSPAERQAMIKVARDRVEKQPRNEAAIIDLAQMLIGFEFRRDALTVLLEGGKKLPQSEAIEREVLALYDRFRDERGRADYLKTRLEEYPERSDLQLSYVKTLYLLDRPDDALKQFDETLKAMKASEKQAQLLEMARFLRNSSMHEQAVPLFRRVLEDQPHRLDILRELAEIHITLGDRFKVRQLFANGVAEEAELENLLDLVQFMIREELFVEARSALRPRLETEAANVELRMVLLEVESRLGAAASGKKLIDETRELADTAARYRLWLESATEFYEEVDTLETFLQEEQQTLVSESQEWNQKSLDRAVIFADVAAKNFNSKLAVQFLNTAIAANPPKGIRIALRRQLITILQDSILIREGVEEQLELLAQENPENEQEYQARLAILHRKRNRQDLAEKILPALDINKINNPALLDQLLPLYQTDSQSWRLERLIQISERLTKLNPTNRGHWERWLTVLAGTSDETRLRSTIRRLLAGIDKMPLADDSRDLLEYHLADSYWRSIARRVLEGHEIAYLDSLTMLDSVERMVQDDQQWLWVTWIRAYILNQLGRHQARDAAITELERMVAQLPVLIEEQEDDEKEKADEPVGPRILFPDGLTISLQHAREILTRDPEETVKDAIEPTDRQGPLPELKARWSYELPRGENVTGIVNLGDSRVLIRNQQFDLICVDASSGKLLWEIEEKRRIQVTNNALPAPLPLSDGGGVFLTTDYGLVNCYSAEDGSLLWRVQMEQLSPSAQAKQNKQGAVSVVTPPTLAYFHNKTVIAWDSLDRKLTKIDKQTGKVTWEQVYPASTAPAPTYNTCGASLFGNQLMVYGDLTAIINVESGEVEWSFEPSRVRAFPIVLDEPTPEIVDEEPGYVWGGGTGGSFPGTTSTILPKVINHLKEDRSHSIREAIGASRTRLTLTAPAVQWASLLRQRQSGYARLQGRRLVLFQSGGFRVIETDFPLASQLVESQGRWVGMSGRILCTMTGHELTFTNVETGTRRVFHLGDLVGANVFTQAIVDGPLVYVVGEKGIACVNAFNSQRVFQVEWPEIVRPAASTTPVAGTWSDAILPPPLKSLPASSLPYRRTTSPPVNISSIRQPVNTQPWATQLNAFNGPNGVSFQPLMTIHDQTLFTTAEPNRVVALEGQQLDGE